MWTKYKIRFDFLTQLCASIPADPEIQAKWLASRTPKNRPADSKSLQEIAEEVMATTPEDVEPSLHIFQRVEGGLAVRMGTIRAHFKDCGRVVSGLSGKLEGEKSFYQKVLNGLYYPPDVYWLPILDQETGKQILEPTGQRDKAIHVKTPRGIPISAIKTFEFVENARLEFVAQVLNTIGGKPVIGQSDLSYLFEYGGTHGYGGERGDGEGRYLVTIEPFEK